MEEAAACRCREENGCNWVVRNSPLANAEEDGPPQCGIHALQAPSNSGASCRLESRQARDRQPSQGGLHQMPQAPAMDAVNGRDPPIMAHAKEAPMASEQHAPSVDHAAAIGQWGLAGGIARDARPIPNSPVRVAS